MIFKFLLGVITVPLLEALASIKSVSWLLSFSCKLSSNSFSLICKSVISFSLKLVLFVSLVLTNFTSLDISLISSTYSLLTSSTTFSFTFTSGSCLFVTGSLVESLLLTLSLFISVLVFISGSISVSGSLLLIWSAGFHIPLPTVVSLYPASNINLASMSLVVVVPSAFLTLDILEDLISVIIVALAFTALSISCPAS